MRGFSKTCRLAQEIGSPVRSSDKMRIAVLCKHDLSSLEPGDKVHTYDKILALAKQASVTLFTPHGYASVDMQSQMRIIQVAPPGIRFALVLSLALFAHRADYDCIYTRDPLLMPFAVPARALGKALILEMNGIPSLGTEIRRRTRRARVPRLTFLICCLMRTIEAFSIRCADLILPVTDRMRKTLLRDYRADARKVIVVPNAVDTTVFRPLENERTRIRQELGLVDETAVLYMSTFSDRWRGSEKLFQTMDMIQRKRKDVVFLVVGSGPLLAEMRAAGERDSLDRMLLTGAIDHRLVPLYMNAADVYVYDVTQVPSELVEKEGSCPTKILESMACGKPVVAPAVPYESMLRKSKGGFPAYSMQQIGVLIERFANSPGLARSMGMNGRRYVELNHDLIRLTRYTIELISKTVSSRRHNVKNTADMQY